LSIGLVRRNADIGKLGLASWAGHPLKQSYELES